MIVSLLEVERGITILACTLLSVDNGLLGCGLFIAGKLLVGVETGCLVGLLPAVCWSIELVVGLLLLDVVEPANGFLYIILLAVGY